jgi:GNAT superfamily N-acetyltransferase
MRGVTASSDHPASSDAGARPSVRLPGVTYRPAHLGDPLVLAEMRWDFRLEDDPAAATGEDREAFVRACEAWIRYRIALGTWTVWVADAGEGAERRIVAHVFVNLVDKVPKPGKLVDRWGYVTNVYTQPAWRGRGIGAELLDWVKVWALGADLEFLQLWPSDASRPFYRRAGFVEEGDAVVFPIRPYAP